ncbi:hypothetical protein [Alteromonas facilis]|uniref:hypothetical protein n=1 Tax=Alteromonas facilis TaxID=2048004 RepID=UPI000C28B113|nr:hypothetical protein [Alteromonas facilis]
MMKKMSIQAAALTIMLSYPALCYASVKPDIIHFPAEYELLNDQLSQQCTRLESRKIEPAEIPDTKISQVQLDCHGFQFEGKSRLAEFVFRDGLLVLVWILTDKSEEASFEKKFIAEYGRPSHQKADFTAFTSSHSALRKDKPEVLFYSPAVAPLFEAWFSNQG